MTTPTPDATGLAMLASGGWLLKKLVGPIADSLGQELLEQFQGYLGNNRRAVLEKAAEQVTASGREAHQIPLRLLLPILDRAGFEDDAWLQDRWASLLAAAATSDSGDTPPVFVMIMAQLTPVAARVADVLYDFSMSDRRHELLAKWGPSVKELTDKLDSVPTSDIDMGLNICQAAGLVEREPPIRAESPMSTTMVMSDTNAYRITPLGLAFVRACRCPASTNQETATDILE